MKAFDFIKSKIKLNKEPKKRLFLKQVSLLCVSLFLLIAFAWAWFTGGNTPAVASGITATMAASDKMEISLNNGETFVNEINLFSPEDPDDIGADNKLDKLSFEDITSDGKTFLRPVFNPENGQNIPNTEKDWTVSTRNAAYISQNVIFRTTSRCDIRMGSGTTVTTSCEIEGKSLASDNPDEIGNISKAGNFSKDCIVGGLRISAVDRMETGDPCRFVCIPRSDIELVRNGENVSVKTGNNVSNNTLKHIYYDSDYMTSGTTVEFSGALTGFANTPRITTTELNESTGYYEATATINVWLEGCDPEVTRMLSGGKFKINFNFVATENNN